MSIVDLIPDLPVINVIDVGAMIFEGKPPRYSGLLKAGRARVVGFEPNSAECTKLNTRAGPNESYHPYFIGDGKDAVYYETNHAQTGSLYPPNTKLLEKFIYIAELLQLRKTHAVKTHRLDDLMHIEAVKDADLINIDVQGAELDVFKGAGKVLNTATVIHTEVEFLPLYEGQPLFGDIDIFLRQAGYQFHFFEYTEGRCFAPFHIPTDPTARIRQVLWADAIYARDFLKLDALPAEKLLKLAVMLDTIYQSIDLAALVLAEVDRRRGSTLAQNYMAMIMAMKSTSRAAQ